MSRRWCAERSTAREVDCRYLWSIARQPLRSKIADATAGPAYQSRERLPSLGIDQDQPARPASELQGAPCRLQSLGLALTVR